SSPALRAIQGSSGVRCILASVQSLAFAARQVVRAERDDPPVRTDDVNAAVSQALKVERPGILQGHPRDGEGVRPGALKEGVPLAETRAVLRRSVLLWRNPLLRNKCAGLLRALRRALRLALRPAAAVSSRLWLATPCVQRAVGHQHVVRVERAQRILAARRLEVVGTEAPIGLLLKRADHFRDGDAVGV